MIGEVRHQLIETPLAVAKFRAWREPLEKEEFLIGADVAEGRVRDRGLQGPKTGAFVMHDRPDYSAAVVIERETGEHVATWHGWVDPVEYGVVLAAIGVMYNGALIVPEINGPGIAVVHKLVDDLRYPNIYENKVWGRASDDPITDNYGWRTSLQTRPLLIARIHEAINSRKLFTQDSQLVSELRTMEYDENGTPRARGKNKDDLVIALGLALQGRYEALYGTLGAGRQEEKKKLRPQDDYAWALVKRHLSNHGSRTNRPRYAFRADRDLWNRRARLGS